MISWIGSRYILGVGSTVLLFAMAPVSNAAGEELERLCEMARELEDSVEGLMTRQTLFDDLLAEEQAAYETLKSTYLECVNDGTSANCDGFDVERSPMQLVEDKAQIDQLKDNIGVINSELRRFRELQAQFARAIGAIDCGS